MVKHKQNNQITSLDGNGRWLGETAAAAYIGRSPWTLRQWRYDGCIRTNRGTEEAPPYHRRGGCYYYHTTELDKWVMEGNCA